MIPKENANGSGAVAIRTKYAGVPLYLNMKIIIKRRKEH